MIVKFVNQIQNLCTVSDGDCEYSCPLVEIDGLLCFCFENMWYAVREHLSPDTYETLSEYGEVITRPYQEPRRYRLRLTNI